MVPDDKERRFLALGQAHVLSHGDLSAAYQRGVPGLSTGMTHLKAFSHAAPTANACGKPIHVAFEGPAILEPHGLQHIVCRPDVSFPAVGGPL